MEEINKIAKFVKFDIQGVKRGKQCLWQRRLGRGTLEQS
jgi:hypothetical protein